jgi:hypothetical protein
MEILPGFKLCRKGLHLYKIEDRTCPECRLINARAWRKNNKERAKENKRKWKKENIEKARQSVRNWCKNNRERKRELDRAYYQRNREHVIKNTRAWTENNRGIANSLWAKRRARKRMAVPAWAKHEEIKKIYKECNRLTKETGVKHAVDHIYPLQSNYMCGLHVENNLQILTAKENNKKYNSTWPGQLDCQKGSVYDIFSKELTDLLK